MLTKCAPLNEDNTTRRIRTSVRVRSICVALYARTKNEQRRLQISLSVSEASNHSIQKIFGPIWTIRLSTFTVLLDAKSKAFSIRTNCVVLFLVVPQKKVQHLFSSFCRILQFGLRECHYHT